MPAAAIIAGTGVYHLPGLEPTPHTVDTPYGQVLVYLAGDLVFLPRHGLGHTVPPHQINYRANLWALHELGVDRVLAVYAVGSLHRGMLPREVALLDDFLDFTAGRPLTFYEGEGGGVGHADMTQPYCPGLRKAIMAAAGDLPIRPHATYACTNGPRLESPAEVRMLARLGGDVVGMTGCPEVALARELGLHFAGVAYSINLGIGLESGLVVVRDLDEVKARLMRVLVDVASRPVEGPCTCVNSVDFPSPAARPVPRAVRE